MVFQFSILIINQNYRNVELMIPVFLTHSRRMLTRLVKFLINYCQIKNLSSISTYTKNQLKFYLIIKSNHLKVDFISLKYYFIFKKRKKESQCQFQLGNSLEFLGILAYQTQSWSGTVAFVYLSIGLQK